MGDISIEVLSGIFLLLVVLSAIFSGAETGMMALNRYRMRHLARDGHRSAILAERLLKHPDRLIGLILLVGNLASFGAGSVATVIAVRLVGEIGVVLAPVIMATVVSICTEVAPKTLAAVYPERIAYWSVYLLVPLGNVLRPIVWIVNRLSNAVLSLFGVNMTERRDDEPMSREELRTVVLEAGSMIPRRHQRMLLSILDLEAVRVDDIMVPRSEIVGIDLNASESDVIEALGNSQHTRLPVYRETIDKIAGILHVRRALRILKDHSTFRVEHLERVVVEPYFVPLGTPLHTQMLNFQRRKQRVGLLVDEYGVIQGLVTLEDILEEIVGEFTTDLQTFNQDIHPQPDGSYLVDGTATIRDINRQLHWDLPAGGPKTLNGLILEHLETMPEPGTSLRIENYMLEITHVADNAVRTVKINRLPDLDDGEEE